MPENSFKDESLKNLFTQELTDFKQQINLHLLSLEKNPGDTQALKELKRIFHSIKGGAKMLGLSPMEKLAHNAEEKLTGNPSNLDINFLFEISDLLSNTLLNENQAIRINPYHLDKIVGLAGESIVESERLIPHVNQLLSVKSSLNELIHLIDQLRAATAYIEDQTIPPMIDKIHEISIRVRLKYGKDLDSLDAFSRQHTTLTERLYNEVLKVRMRPFGDATIGLPRFVRDLSLELGKKIEIEIEGKQTLVDRDILEGLENQLIHLIRNAMDHGIENEGLIKISAAHKRGLLHIVVSDNGKGLDLDKVRETSQNLTLSNQDAIKRIFLQGFSTKDSVTMLSGRGVGLNSVKQFVDQLGGSIKVDTNKGLGTSFILDLPIALSVMRTLIVEDLGNQYALPLSKIEKAVHLPSVQFLYEKPFYFDHESNANISLIPLSSIFKLPSKPLTFPLHAIIISKEDRQIGLVVDHFHEQKDLVVKKLDERLGKIPTVVAGSTLEDGSPILILDIDELFEEACALGSSTT